MKAVARVLLALCAGAIVMLAVVLLRQMLRVEPEPASAQAAALRVDLLADDPDAVILMPFVTGDVARLVAGARLKALQPQLWYDDEDTVGGLFGGLAFAMMGLPPITDIATGFHGGVAIRDHSCITITCNLGAQNPTPHWGMAGLRGLGDALGPEVRREYQSFDDHTAYLAAHAAVLADPLQWFALPGDEVPQTGDDGMRLVVISLPTELLAHGPDVAGNDEDATREAVLTVMAVGLVAGTGGTVDAVLGTAPMPIWALKDGSPIWGADGSRALPDLTYRNPVLRLSIPVAQVEALRQRALALDLPGPDRSVVAASVKAAFAAWGLETACLPDCGDVGIEFYARLTLDRGPEPFWTLNSWRVPAPEPGN